IELAIGLGAALAQQDLAVFEGRRVDRREAVRAIDLPDLLQQLLAWDHQLGKVIAEAAERPWFDEISHGQWSVVSSQWSVAQTKIGSAASGGARCRVLSRN